MAVNRPTFHEAWYRVAPLSPRLLSGVNVYRQNFRGQIWYVLENTYNNKFIRISPDAYRFVALLDGYRTVSEAWNICNEQLGDRAPTQGEAIQILAQLYSSNMLYGDISPDTESLFNRYRKRVTREIQGFFTNLLFIRIPLINPDNFLDRWVDILGQVFTKTGLILWLLFVSTGLYVALSNISELFHESREVLAPANLIFLYMSIVVVKVFHEFSHAFACKKFGKLNQGGGQVNVMGVMFLVFLPLPYMDASSAWAFRNKWHRIVVGLAGIMAEMAFATLAVLVWANTAPGTVHAIAYNIIFVASISTILFNGNPLLRYDAYYVLSDLLEIPNLSQRSRDYFFYIVKRYAWKIKGVTNPAHTRGEKIWFILYGTASTFYRIYILIIILLFLNDRLPEELFILVPMFAITGLIMWVLFPLGKFIHYLATSGELIKTRKRAVTSTLGALAVTGIFIGLINMPYHSRIEGIVEPEDFIPVHARSEGFVVTYLPSGENVSPDSDIYLVKAINPEMEAEKKGLLFELKKLQIQRRIMERQEVAGVQIMEEQIEALKEKIGRIEKELTLLRLRAPVSGIWISPHIDRAIGTYLKRGEQIGYVASLDNLIIRATAGQELVAMLMEQAYKDVEIRVKGRPDLLFTGRIEKISSAGQEILPSEALGYAGGGEIPVHPRDPRGLKAAEKFFEVRIRLSGDRPVQLFPGQKVIVRISLGSKPLGVQWWQSFRQLFQRRFRI